MIARTGTDTGADGDYAEQLAITPTTLWALTADRHRPGSLAQSVERLGLAARAVRDQMSNDTWMVLAAVERAVLQPSDRARHRQGTTLPPPDSKEQALDIWLAPSKEWYPVRLRFTDNEDEFVDQTLQNIIESERSCCQDPGEHHVELH